MICNKYTMLTKKKKKKKNMDSTKQRSDIIFVILHYSNTELKYFESWHFSDTYEDVFLDELRISKLVKQ